MEKLTQIINVLQELRIASKSIHSETDLRVTMNKYDILFLGEKFNKINTIELHHCLKTVFELDYPKDEFLNLIPVACKTLNMKTEALVLAEDTSKLSAYFIQLF